MPGPGRRNRQSCDRCHSQHLKCPKQDGTKICLRCKKADVRCVFSAHGTGSTTAPQSTDTTFPWYSNEDIAHDSATASGFGDGPSIDWPFLPDSFGLDASANTTLDQTLLDVPEPETAAEVGQDGHGYDEKPFTETHDAQMARCTKQLAAVLLDLDAAWETLPRTSELHVPHDDNLSQATSEFANKYSQHNFPEAIFISVQQLIDLYPFAIQLSLALHVGPVPQCEVEDCAHRLHVPPSLAGIEQYALARSEGPTINVPLFNLLVSCHLRLLDVLDRVLVLVVSCFKVTLASPTQEEPDFWIPQLRVGSFTPKRNVAAFTQAFMLKHLLDKLSAREESLEQAIAKKQAEGDANAECRLLLLQCEMLKQRHGTKMDQLAAIGRELSSLGLLK